MPLAQLFLLHSSGECLFNRIYYGAPVSLSSVISITSSLSIIDINTDRNNNNNPNDNSINTNNPNEYTKIKENNQNSTTKLNTGDSSIADVNISTLIISCIKYSLLRFGSSLTLITANSNDFNDIYINIQLIRIKALLMFYCGNKSLSSLSDCNSIIIPIIPYFHNYLLNSLNDLSIIPYSPILRSDNNNVNINTNKWLLIDNQHRESIDRLLSTLESHNSSIISTLLTIQSTIIHSRASPQLNSQIINFIETIQWKSDNDNNNNNSIESRCISVDIYYNSEWFSLTIFNCNSFEFAMINNKNTTINDKIMILNEFSELFNINNIQLPNELPSLLLRHYISPSSDCCLFSYFHINSNCNIIPQIRSGINNNYNKEQLNKLIEFFQCSIAKSLEFLNNSNNSQSISQSILTLQFSISGYRFSVISCIDYVFYSLYNDSVNSSQCEILNKEIIEKIHKIHANIIEES